MMTVKRYSRGPGATPIGKPALHPVTIDLKGKAYEYVSLGVSVIPAILFPSALFPLFIFCRGFFPS